MRFASIRIPSDDVARLVGFYEQLTGVPAAWANDQFAEILLPGATIALSSRALTDAFAAASVVPEQNATVMVELLVDDVDAEFARARALGEVVMDPTTLPWGNRSALLRDPDGNVVNLFTPVTPEAVERFSRR
jgi:predicted enzyme related to lactoylglutathione lyase